MPTNTTLSGATRLLLAPCLACALALQSIPAHAGTLGGFAAEARNWLSEAQLLWENDTFAGSDRYYTNGIKFGGAVSVPEKILAPFKLPADAAFRLVRGESATFAGLFFGQNIYTPRLIGVTQPQPFDRPWAGWTYLGTVLQTVGERELHTIEFDVGMIGAASLAGDTQTRIHDLAGAPEPRGWSNQLRNEPAFLIAYLHKQRYGTDRLDFLPHAGVTLGTVQTLARAGGMVRLGRNMTGFGPDRIDPGAALLQNARRASDQARAHWEYYAFAGADLRYVVHNVFLDGSLFRGGPGVARLDTVYDLSAGLSVRWGTFRLTLSRIHRSDEFSTPLGRQGRQTFYSLNLGWERSEPTRAAPVPR